MKTWRKEFSLLLVGMMIMSGLVAFSAPVIAHRDIGGSIEARCNDAWMIVRPGYTEATEDKIVLNYDGFNNKLYYLGDEEARVNVVFRNTGTDLTLRADTAITATISVTSGNAVITVGDVSTFSTGTLATWVAGAAGDVTTTFTVDIGKSAAVETEYPMRISLTYHIDAEASPTTRHLDFHIYVSSIFHDPAAGVRDTTHELEYTPPNVGDYIRDNTGGDTHFRAGDKFREALFGFVKRAPAAVDIKNTEMHLTAPPTHFTLINRVAKVMVDPIVTGTTYNHLWRMDVNARTPPGVYQGSVLVNYTRTVAGAEKLIEEARRNIDFTVGFNFADAKVNTPPAGKLWGDNQCYATNVVILNDTRQVDYVAPYPDDIPTIQQDSYTDRLIQAEVTIVNNGNTPLYNVRFEIVPGSAITGWTYFRNPRFFWTSAAGSTYDTISDTFDMAIGATVTLSIEMIVLKNVPIGEHRLPIIYNGYYFNDGSVGGSTGFFQTNGGTGLQVIFAINVADDTIDCHISTVTFGATSPGDKARIFAETITVNILNREAYGFIHITAQADFTGTPWYMPVIGMRDPMVWADTANEVRPHAAWGAADTFSPVFTVDTDPSFAPDRYPFLIHITAVIQETLEVVSVTLDYRHGAVIDMGGYGPKIQISAMANTDIVPGKAFELTLTIENVGDEALRNAYIEIPCDDTEYYDGLWDVEADFKEQFDWSNIFSEWGNNVGSGVTWSDSDFPSEMFYTMESLDVDNVREIVEIALYIDGVYSKPGARISLVRILDLAPGASTEVTFEMYADKDMVNGKPYMIEVTVFGWDNTGTGVYSVDGGETLYISVMSSLPGKSYNPVELNWFDAGLKALALFLFFIIVLAILLFVYNMFKGEPYDEGEEDFDFEDDEPLEPTTVEPAPEAPPEQELIEP